MQSARKLFREAAEQTPWSPISVSFISLLLPAGGAILTIRNLRRLGQMDDASAQRLTLAVYGVFVLGLTALLLSAHKGAHGFLQLDANASTALSIGVAVASYAVQRMPYRTWRTAHQELRPSSWLGGAGRAILYTVITFAVVLPFALTGMLLGIDGIDAGTA